MANTLGGINLAQIAQETLRTLVHQFFPLSAFTTDFNDDIKDKGESVATRVVTAVAAQDLSGGYSATDVTTTAKTITLNQFKGFVYAFTDAEVSKAGDAGWLQRMIVDPAIAATREAVMDTILALVTVANFSSGGVITSANFDADDLADLAGTLSTAKVPKGNRFAMLSPTYFASLGKDNAIQVANAYGDRGPVVDNRIPRVHGFDIFEYTDIPTNGESLAGIVGGREGLIIAARQPATPQYFTGDIENITDPTTGLPIQLRAWYDHNNGKVMFSMGVLYGASVGVAGNIHRVTSA